MDGYTGRESIEANRNGAWKSGGAGTSTGGVRLWRAHAAHGAGGGASAVPAPHRAFPRPKPWRPGRTELRLMTTEQAEASERPRPVRLDGSRGEGGGQILRTALSLSLLTGRPFHMTRIRANRDKPGLRPQHKTAVEAAAELGRARVTGATVGAREILFQPEAYAPRDLTIDIGTAGSTALVLQTLHLPIAMRAERPVEVVIHGGTFNPRAPAFAFLESTWRAHLAAFGLPLTLAMPVPGFYPRGGGRLEAWIEPAAPRARASLERGPLARVRARVGIANLDYGIAERMRDRAIERLQEHGIEADAAIDVWGGAPGQGVAISLTAEHENTIPATFVGLGARGQRAETVADEAVEELLAFEAVPGAAVDPFSADQVLLPLAFAPGPSSFTVSAITEHLRTNAETIAAFLDRSITIEEAEEDGAPGRVSIA